MSTHIVKRIFHFLRGGLLVLLALGAWHCTGDPAQTDDLTESDPARKIIERAIDAHGFEKFDSIDMSFIFRDRRYSVFTDHGLFRYGRDFTDSIGVRIEDVLTNDGLQRSVEGQTVNLTEKDKTAYTGSINSVRYFFMLPYGLEDPSVLTRLLESTTINDGVYDRIEVTFEGADKEHDDVYHYFFNRETGEMDYLAYSFGVNDGGIRFREAINKRMIGDLLVQDYKNYGVDGDDRDLTDVDRRFTEGELPLLSSIINSDITIVGQAAGQ